MINPHAKEVQKFIDGVPNGLEMVNLGSTFSKFGFDYKYFGKKGFNFAVQPQTLTYDCRVLKQYARNINKGALVIVVVCPFGFSVDYYRNDNSDYKYYFFLDKNEIQGYSKAKELIIKYLPFLAGFALFRLTKKAAGKLLRMLGIKHAEEVRNKDPRINSWIREFDLNDVTDGRQADKLASVFANTVDSLRKILEICNEHEFKPVIINMPAVKAQSSEFSEEFIESFYTANVERANFCGAPVIDYFCDKRFNDSSLYENSTDCLNDKGREYFAGIFIKDLKKLGLWED